jgi:hypothetical protein
MANKKDVIDRQNRIFQMYSSIKKANEKGNAAGKEKIIGIAMCDFGISRRFIMEYLNALIDSERVILTEEGELWVKEFEKYGK